MNTYTMIFHGRTYSIKPGPKGEPTDVPSPTEDELARLDALIARGARIRRSGPLRYEVSE